MSDAALGAPKDAAEFPVRTVVDDIVATVTIEDVELAIRQVERPRRAILVCFVVFPCRFGPEPLIERGAIESGFLDAVGGEVGDKQNLARAFSDEGEAVRAGESSAPLVHEFPLPVVDDHVVGRVIRQQNDVAGAIAGEAVAIFDGRRGIEDAPARHDAVTEVALAEEGTRAGDGWCRLRGRPHEGTAGEGGGRAEEIPAGQAGHEDGVGNEEGQLSRPAAQRTPRAIMVRNTGSCQVTLPWPQVVPKMRVPAKSLVQIDG